MRYRYATSADAPDMAELFAANHYDTLTEQQRVDQGFVQGGFDSDALRAMAEDRHLLLADDAGRVAGLLALSPPESLPAPPPPLLALLSAQDSLLWQGHPLGEAHWLLYGPVVVSADYRGQGVARGLFDMAVEAAAGRTDAVVAFIESANRPSWRVHVDGFGMIPLGEITADGRSYSVVATAPAPPTGT